MLAKQYLKEKYLIIKIYQIYFMKLKQKMNKCKILKHYKFNSKNKNLNMNQQNEYKELKNYYGKNIHISKV